MRGGDNRSLGEGDNRTLGGGDNRTLGGWENRTLGGTYGDEIIGQLHHYSVPTFCVINI